MVFVCNRGIFFNRQGNIFVHNQIHSNFIVSLDFHMHGFDQVRGEKTFFQYQSHLLPTNFPGFPGPSLNFTGFKFWACEQKYYLCSARLQYMLKWRSNNWNIPSWIAKPKKFLNEIFCFLNIRVNMSKFLTVHVLHWFEDLSYFFIIISIVKIF